MSSLVKAQGSLDLFKSLGSMDKLTTLELGISFVGQNSKLSLAHVTVQNLFLFAPPSASAMILDPNPLVDLELDFPCLRKLELHGRKMKKLVIKGSKEGGEESHGKLNAIKITACLLNDEWTKNNVPRFPNLLSLVLSASHLKAPNLTHPKLEKLAFLRCTKLSEASLALPRLRFVQIEDCRIMQVAQVDAATQKRVQAKPGNFQFERCPRFSGFKSAADAGAAGLGGADAKRVVVTGEEW